VRIGAEVLSSLTKIAGSESIDKTKMAYCIELAKEGRAGEISTLESGVIAITARGKQIKCKTVGQKTYVDAIKKNTVVFGVGPAGTGKTYLAVCMAVSAFKSKQVEKIILTRPAVEAGEKLGFLPGDLHEKVDPYLRPLYDALQEMLGLETYGKLMERGAIEVAPLAYMRGRTLSNAFIILDEAQNTTKEQMKMFLTRMGEGSKTVVTGDVTQIDLDGKDSGLVHATDILDGVDGISVCRLTAKDVVRHPLVMRIIRAYEKDAERADKSAIEKTRKTPKKKDGETVEGE
jgi:phosphate starvation-inducible PhoH-like protein